MLRQYLFVLALISSPLAAQEVYVPDLPEGYPPKMGVVSGSLGGIPVAWETFDFSIGAFDASAWVGEDYESGKVGAYLTGYPPGDPDTKAGRVYAGAEFGAALHTGKGRKPLVEIYQGQDRDGPRLSSDGEKARFVIESIGPATEGSYSRRVTGQIEARLCPINWEGQVCQDIVLTFDTDMQIESSIAVRE